MTIEVNEIIRSRRKTLALVIKPDASLIVRAPLKASEKSIKEFIEKNMGWIRKKQAQARAFVAPTPKRYDHGEKFLYLGNPYPLEIVERQKQPLLFDGHFKLAERAQGRAPLEFERWYRARAREILVERVSYFAAEYELKFQGVKINAARTRWGSCSAKGSLNFSWRLMMAPMESVDYVVAHELVHTLIHNHSKRFWNKVESIMPDYKARRMWLQKHGPELML
jgi:predicted metal-dependent hydrolase